MKKRVADIIFSTLVEMGITDCFAVVGGGAMYLDNALLHNTDMTKYFNHHEQACAMAAEAYARASGKMPVVCVTSGPGGTNTLTGVITKKKDLDTVGCNFAIYRTKRGNVIYGETEITMLDDDLNKKWSFSGMDIFVSVNGTNPFEMKEDRICLFDFYDHYYEIDYDGNLLNDIASS